MRDHCIKLGLDQCIACRFRLTLMRCSIMWFKDNIEHQGFIKARKQIGDGDKDIYFYAAVKLYYPQYEKLLILL